MSKKKEVILRKAVANSRLNTAGQEVIDSVPFAVAMGIKPSKSMEQRIAEILRDREIKANPEWGMDNDDDNDFEVPDEMPLYEFERRHEALEAAKAEVEAAKKELDEAQKEAQQKRAEAYKDWLASKKARKVEATVIPDEDTGSKDDSPSTGSKR